MRIVLIGQAAFGEKVLEALLSKNENIVGVFCPPDPPGKPSGMKKLAESKGIPVYQPEKMKDPYVYDVFVQLQPDLNIMAFVTDIVPKRILDYPKLKTIQYHPSLLPKHRGGTAIHWAVINGEAKTGLTIFWPDHGIDTGPIILQKEVEISHDDTASLLYFNSAVSLLRILNTPSRARRLIQYGGGGGNRTRVRKHYLQTSTCLACNLIFRFQCAGRQAR